MKSIIEREATFEKNSDMEVKVTQKQLSRAFVKALPYTHLYLASVSANVSMAKSKSILFTKSSFSSTLVTTNVGINSILKY